MVFVLCGWTDPSARAAILTVGTVVCIAASKAGDISQDLKTGYLVGATPAKQQLGQFLGAACACWAIAGTVLLLGNAFTFGSPELPAPQATLMKTVIEGVLSGSLPWALVGTGSALSICAIIAGLPGLSFAVGIYLPLGTLAPIFVGGIVRRMVDATRARQDRRQRSRRPRRLGHDRRRRAGRRRDRLPGGREDALARIRLEPLARFVHFAGKEFAWIPGAAGVILGIGAGGGRRCDPAVPGGAERGEGGAVTH